MKELKIAFFGTPLFATDVLDELEAAGVVPSVVVTAPDAPRGRGMTMTPPGAKVWAEERDISILQPETLRLDKGDDPDRDILYNSEWDLFLVASYGKILPEALLALPHHKALNVHPSLLPRYRGASPIRSAILDDARDTVGITIMELVPELDAGPILAQARIEIEEWPPHALMLERLLAREGGKLLAEAIAPWVEETLTAEPQDASEATFSKKLEKGMGLLDLAQDPYKNFLKIRALEGNPGTYFFVEKNGKKIRVKIADAEYTDGVLTILKVIPEGKKEMSYEDFARSHKSE